MTTFDTIYQNLIKRIMEEFNKAKSRAESGQITRETVAEFDTDAPQEGK